MEKQVGNVDTLCTMLGQELAPNVIRWMDEIVQRNAVYKVNPPLLDSFIADIDMQVSAQMDAILHNKDFQELESVWRGLHHLVQSAKFTRPVRIEILDASKEEIQADLQSAVEGEGLEIESGLFQHIYWNAYDKVGGHPYSTIVADYRFDSSPRDVNMLSYLSMIGEMAQIPFIGNASPQFFGRDNFGQVMNDHYFVEQMEQDDIYTAWRAFRDDDRSKYIGLVLPRFMGRLTYGPETDPTRNFNYTENAAAEDDYLWCNASFALAGNMVRSFEEWGWSCRLVGTDSGGRVAGLPLATYEEGGQKKVKVPLEASVGKQKDIQLSELGFISLAHWDRTDYGVFFELASTQKPPVIKDDPEATGSFSVGARLQYMMLITRIAHYLQYRQLRFVGRNAGAGEIEADLEKWLDTLVADYPNPSEEVIGKRPLRSYELTVEELEEQPGFFMLNIEIRPHVAIVGMDISLRLVAYHTLEDKKK